MPTSAAPSGGARWRPRPAACGARSRSSWALARCGPTRRRTSPATRRRGGKTPLLGGVAARGPAGARAPPRAAAAAGGEGLLPAPVPYTPLTDEEVFQHFAAVAGAPALPLCIYNNPATTHFSFG